MGLGAWLFGGAAESAAKPIEAVGNTLDQLFTSDDERAAAAVVMEKLRQQPDILQVELNKVEATHPSVFVAGWRPALGWVCVMSLGLYYPVRILVGMTMWVIMVIKGGGLLPLPDVGIADVLGLVAAMLGMSGLRTIEKKNDVAR